MDCRDRILHEDDVVYKFNVNGPPFVADTKREQQAKQNRLKTDPVASLVLRRRMSEDSILFQWPNRLKSPYRAFSSIS